MWSRIARVALPAVALLLAGCGGFAAGPTTGGPDGGPTLTPAPVPETPGTFSPGVSDTGVSVGRVIDTHERRLATTNYTSTSRQVVTGSEGRMWTVNHTRRIGNGERRYAGRIEYDVVEFPLGRLPDPYEYWANETAYASRRFVSEDDSFYGFSEGDVDGGVDPSPLLARALSAVPVAATERPRGATLSGEGLRRAGRFPNPPYLENPRDVSLSARVVDGVIVRWRLRYDATVDGRTVRVVRTARIDRVGSTTVERPDWVDAARERIEAQTGDDD